MNEIYPPRRRLTGGVIALIVALCLAVALSAGLILYLVNTSRDRSVAEAQLRVQQEELDRRAYQLSLSEGETDELEARIEALQATNDDLRRQINELDSQLGAADSERNQSTSNYIQQVADMEQELRQLEGSYKTLEAQAEALQEANDTMTEDFEALEQELEELIEERDELEDELLDLQDRYDLLVDNYRRGDDDNSGPDTSLYLSYKKKADFLDSYIVFVQDDSTNYFHSYDCPKFTNSTFWAHNRALAKSHGYHACPSCGGGE